MRRRRPTLPSRLVPLLLVLGGALPIGVAGGAGSPGPGPTPLTTSPPSPAAQVAPRVVGTAPAGTRVGVFAARGAAADGCAGTALATAPAADLAAGIAVPLGADGTYRVRLATIDELGVPTRCSAPLTYVLDTRAPDTVLTARPADVSWSRPTTVRFRGTERQVRLECRLDRGAGWTGCTSPWSIRLGPGVHVLRMRARDGAGNVDTTPAVATWTVQAPG